MLSVIIILSTVAHNAMAQLVIKACCGQNTDVCENFERAEDLFGMACCGNTPYNTYSQLCCEGFVHDRNQGGAYAELCCGTQVLRYDQTCCSGVVHNVINGDCCGTAVHSKLDRNNLCCNGTLARTSSPSDVCCGSTVFDGGRSQICCGDQPSDKTLSDSCCKTNSGSFVPFKSSTHFCCNGAFPRNSDFSCCYLRVNGEIVVQEYNKQSLCCRYPYDMLHGKGPNGTCVEARKKRDVSQLSAHFEW